MDIDDSDEIMENKINNSNLSLELGYIIKIYTINKDDSLDNKIFYIDYLDNNIIKLISYDNYEKIILNIDNFQLSDKNIEKIAILDIPKHKGYAKQNDLIIGKLISIEFGGNEPMIVNGKITNLEEDRIELNIYKNGNFNEHIYIDFGYKGIPLDLPIISIKPYILPVNKLNILDMPIDDENIEDTQLNILDEQTIEDFYKDTENIPNLLNKVILTTDDIIMGKLLGEISEEIEVKDIEKRFALEIQTNDLLDNILSNIPNNERTYTVLNNIHTSIERFTELRYRFSNFDSKGNVKNIKTIPINNKPLLNQVLKININNKWFIPIVKANIKDYSIKDNDDDEDNMFKEQAYWSKEYGIKLKYKNNDLDSDNQSSTYLNIINDMYTPYYNSSDTNNVLYINNVNNDIETYIDNKNNDFQYINYNQDKYRFHQLKYITGINKYTYDQINKTNVNHNIVPNDKMVITGFLKLPMEYVNLSRLYIKGSNILDKLNIISENINKWQILDNVININNIELNENSEPIKFNDKYINQIYAYRFNNIINYNDKNDNEKHDTYQNFLNNIIPTNKQIFNIVKSKISYNLNEYDIVKYLEPFNIYNDNITYKLYDEIHEFIYNTNIEYTKKLYNNIIDTQKYINYPITNTNDSIITDIFYNDNEEINKQIYENLLNLYDLSHIKSTSEELTIINNIDNGLLYKTSLMYSNLDLYKNFNLEDIVIEKVNELNNKIVNNNDINNCNDGIKLNKDNAESNILLAKRYTELTDLLKDENKDIYFDTKYDDTRYDILDSFNKDMLVSMNNENKYEYIKSHLISIGITENIDREVNALILGKKMIIDGDYCILDMGDYDYKYFIRINNKWRIDESKNFKQLNDVNFCNLQKKCMTINKNCTNYKIIKDDVIKHKFLKQMEDEFIHNLYKNNDIVINLIKDNYKKYSNKINILKTYNNNKLLKQNNIFLKISQQYYDDEKFIESPYISYRDTILNIDDMAKRYDCILIFINNYCREYNINDVNENKHWYYCSETNTPLLPTYFKDLANAYNTDNYMNTIKNIEKTRGTLSGDIIIDKHSGFYISNILFDTNEGYDGSGFKINTREVLKDNINEHTKTLNSYKNTSVNNTNKMIYNIFNTLNEKLGIDNTNNYEYIVKHSTLIYNNEINNYTEEQFNIDVELKKKKGNKIKINYTDLKYEILFNSIIASYILYIQLSIPPIKTDKEFGNICKKSFTGYPLYSDNDMSYLNYITCVILKTRSNENGWKSVPKTNTKNFNKIQEMYNKKIKIYIDKLLLIEEINNKIQQKYIWDKTNVQTTEIISYEFNVSTWKTFLPILFPFKIHKLRFIGNGFENKLINNIKNGNISYVNDLHELYGTIVKFSLTIQEDIQRVIDKNNILLYNNQGVYYQQNTCCNDDYKLNDITRGNCTILYFTDKDKIIKTHNKQVNILTNIYNKYKKLSMPEQIYIDIETKQKYSEPIHVFNNIIVYKTFIKYCNINNNKNIPDDLKSLCITNNSSYTNNDDIDVKIDILKKEGHYYTNDDLNNLLNIVGMRNNNNIDIKLYHTIETNINKLNEYIEQLLLNTIEYDKDDDGEPLHYNEYYKSDIANNKYSINDYLNKLTTILSSNDIYINNNNANNNNKNKIHGLFNDINDINKNIRNIFLNKLKRSTHISKKYKQIEKIINNLTNPININDYDNDNNKQFWKNISSDININNDDEINYSIINIIKNFIYNINNVYPNIITNGNIKHDTLNIPNTWDISNKHKSKLNNYIINGNDNNDFNNYTDNIDIVNLLNIIKNNNKFFTDITNLIPFYINMDYLNKLSIFNGKNVRILLTFLLLNILNNYYDYIDIHLKDIDNGDDFAYLDKKKELNNHVADLIYIYFNKLEVNIDTVNFSKNDIKTNIIKLKKSEKKKITDKYKLLTDEARSIEFIHQQLKLGKWNKGLSTGVYKYDKDTYDKEYDEILGDINMGINVELYNPMLTSDDLEALDNINNNKDIDDEVYDLNNIFDDDDNGNFDTDVY